MNALWSGEPIDCACGRAMRVVWTDAVYARTGTWEKVPIGKRFIYRCDCGREVDVRTKERGASRQPAAGSGQGPGGLA
jgi:hypothetical protein